MTKTATPFLLMLAFAMSGCQTTSVAPISGPPSSKLSRSEKVYVVTPRDGSYGEKTYSGSGSAVATTLEAAFARYAPDVIVGSFAESLSDAAVVAKQKGCGYIVSARITHWEDRATEWSGKRDKLGFIVRVVRTDDQSQITTAEISGKSSLMTMGGDRPQDMLEKPIEEFVSTLYQ